MILIDIAGITIASGLLVWLAVEFAKAIAQEIREARA